MLLAKRDGIQCDICRSTYTQDFEYYSFDFREVRVHNNTMDMIRYNTPTCLSIDTCEACNDRLKKLIVKNYKASLSLPMRLYKEGIYCDLTGAKMIGTYVFFHCAVTKAIVRMAHKPYICLSCQTTIKDTENACPKCQENNFGKKADIISDNRIYEFWTCEEAYKQFVPSEQEIKQREEAAQWSSSGE